VDLEEVAAVNPWSVLEVERVIDGDSLILTRARLVGETDDLFIYAADKDPVRVRLVHVDTPERGEEGWGLAKQQLETWTAAWEDDLVLHTVGRDNFGRILGDLKNSDGTDSATLHLVRDCGWPTWQETR
jgi:endonuclease YncB( thermonuclease family)